MNLLDLLIMAMFTGNMMLGYFYGLIRRVFVFVGLFAGVGAATLTSAQGSAFLATSLHWMSPLWAQVVTYAAIVIFAVILFEVLGAAYDRYLNAIIAPMFDRLAAMLVGAVLAALEITLVFMFGIGIVDSSLPTGYATPPAFNTMQQLFYGSFLAPHFVGLEPLTHALFATVLPTSIGAYFTQLLAH